MTGHPTLSVHAPATIDGIHDDLLRRHGDAAWGLAGAILRDDAAARRAVDQALRAVCAAIDRGSFPAGLSMTSAVLAATRGTALAALHKAGPPTTAPAPDPVDRAFSSLPECWRSALWLLEAQGLRPVEAALPLRLAPGDVVEVGASACAAFCSRYVSFAVDGREQRCRETASLLVVQRRGGELAPHEVAAVDQHLAGCPGCRAIAEVLHAPGPSLRAAIGRPLPASLRVAATTARAPHRDRVGTLREYAAVLVIVVATTLAFASAGMRIHGSIVDDGPEAAAGVVDGGRERDIVRAFAAHGAVPADLGAADAVRSPAAAGVVRAAPAAARAQAPTVAVAATGPAGPTPGPPEPADSATDDNHSDEVSISTPETRDDVPAQPSAQVEVRLTEGSEPAVVVELAEVRVEVAVSAEQAVGGDPEGTGPAAPQALGSGA